ncbi:MAG: hypothetical protein IT337_12585, partial [Thermomicrobiales bacterium]|nr:hypothetical protein [Thermomicrobiales bacterium]
MIGGGSAIGTAHRGRGETRLVAAVLAAALLTAGAVSALAAGTTPVPTPDAPEPALCRVEPVPLAEIEAAIAAATPTAGTSRMRDVVPAGEPTDAATAAGVTATVRELVACFNAGELLR